MTIFHYTSSPTFPNPWHFQPVSTKEDDTPYWWVGLNVPTQKIEKGNELKNYRGKTVIQEQLIEICIISNKRRIIIISNKQWNKKEP